MTKYEKIFREQAIVGYPEYRKQFTDKKNRWKEDELYKRCRVLNKNFQFTPRNVQRLKEVNKLLADKERWAYKQARQLEKFALKEKHKSNSFISDFMIEFEVGLFSEKIFKRTDELYGQPFYIESKPEGYFMEYKPDKKNDAAWQKEFKRNEYWTLKENHNEYQHCDQHLGDKPHPLRKQHHCWLFHQLYDHTFLAWQDLLVIDMIWFDVQLIVQNGTKIRGKKYEMMVY